MKITVLKMITKFFILLIISVILACNNYVPNQYFFDEELVEFVDLTQNFVSNGVQTDIHNKYWYVGKSSKSNRCFINGIGTYLDNQYYQLEDQMYNETMQLRRNPMHNEIELKNLILPLIIVDISGQVNNDPGFILTAHHLDYMLNNYFGKTTQPTLVVFKFGWSKYFQDQHKYFGLNGNTTHFPGISTDLAKWITTSFKNVVCVGVDLPSIDPGLSDIPSAHNIFINAGVYVIHNIKLDDYVPDAWCTAIVSPLKVVGEGRLPLRFTAICPKSKMEAPNNLLHRL